METFIRKERNGYTATTTCHLDGTDFTFKLNTHKTYSGELVTNVSCCKKNGMFESFRMYQDFYKACAKEKVRVTEKAVTTQHERFKKDIAAYMDEAKAYYSSPNYIAKYGEEKPSQSKTILC